MDREDVVRDIRTTHAVLLPDGEMIPAEQALDAGLIESPALRALVANGAGSSLPVNLGATLQRLGLCVPATDAEPGHFRWLPHGVLVRRLIKEWQEALVVDLFGAAEIETPLIFARPGTNTALDVQTSGFGERLYGVTHADGERPHLLRYGGDPGFLGLLRDTAFTDAQLPLRVWEFLTAYRRERSGELRGVHRARAFSFFDCHSVCRDKRSGLEEYRRILDGQFAFLDGLRGDYGCVFSWVGGAREEAGVLRDWARAGGRSALVEILSRRRHYYSLMHNVHDAYGLATMHGQFDLVTPSVWRLGRSDGLALVHAATGTLERWLTAFVVEALRSPAPRFPVWLAPVQVRLAPLSPRSLEAALTLARSLADRGIRADVDDRSTGLGRKLRAGAERWIPYLVVLGDREAETGEFEVHQPDGRRIRMTERALVSEIETLSEGKPRRPQPYGRLRRQPFRP